MRDYLTTIPLQVSLLIIVLSVTYLIQRFWFMRAWRLINRVSRPTSRTLLRSLLFVAVSAVLITVLDSALGHILPRNRAVDHLVTGTKLWVSRSFLAVLSTKAVGAFNCMSGRILTVITPFSRGRLNSSRRAFV